MRGFAVYFLLLAALPHYVTLWFSAIFRHPNFPRAGLDAAGAMSPEEFESYYENSTKAVGVVKSTLLVIWLIGIVASLLLTWWILVLPVLASAAFLSWYFQISHRIEVESAAMLAKTFSAMWQATLSEAYLTIQTDDRLKEIFDQMHEAMKLNNTEDLERAKNSVSAVEWNELRHAQMFQMGLPDPE